MSDGPFVCYRELAPTTSVLSCTYFHCFNAALDANELYLATITATTLSIFKVESRKLGGDVMSLTAATSADADQLASLVLTRTERVFGHLKDIKACKRHNSQHDLLIVSIDEGKIIALEYIPEDNTFHEAIIANVEHSARGVGADIKASRNERHAPLGMGSDSVIRVSEKFHLLSVLVYGEYLFLASMDHEKQETWNSDRIAHQRQLVHIQQDLKLKGSIIDMAFVHGYSSPVLAILHEESSFPVGHGKATMHTCALTMVAIDLHLKSTTVLWTRRRLPHDSLSLIELSMPCLSHCVAVVCQNAFLVVSQSSVRALAMNAFASITVDRSTIELVPWQSSSFTFGLELDASSWVTLSSDSATNSIDIIGFLRSGHILHVHLLVPIADVFASMRIQAKTIGECARPSCVAATVSAVADESVRNEWIFVGTRQGQCALYSVKQLIESSPKRFDALSSTERSFFQDFVFVDRQQCRKQRDECDLNCQSSKRKTKLFDKYIEEEKASADDNDDTIGAAIKSELNSAVGVSDLTVLMYEEEQALYGTNGIGGSLVPTTTGASSFSESTKSIALLRVDGFDVMGPILTGTTTKSDELFSQRRHIEWDRHASALNLQSMHTVSSYLNEKECKEALILSSGLEEDTMLHRIFSGVGLGKVGARNFPGATRMSTLSIDTYCLLIVSYETKTRVLQCKENSLNSSSSLEHVDLKFAELSEEDSGLICSSPTIAAGVIHSGMVDDEVHIVTAQVVSLGIRLVRMTSVFGAENEALQDVLLNEAVDIGGLGGEADEYIITADFCEGFLVVTSNYQNLFVLRYDSNDQMLQVIGSQASQRTRGLQMNRAPGQERLSFIQHDIASASLYFGELSFECRSSTHQTLSQVSPQLTDRQREEFELYGEVLPESDTPPLKDSSELIDLAIQNSSELAMDVDVNGTAPTASTSSRAVLVITDIQSVVYFVDAESLECLWHSSAFATNDASVRVQPQLSVSADGRRDKEQMDSSSKRFVVESKLCRLAFSTEAQEQKSSDPSLNKLVLLLLFHTGELVVYDAFESAAAKANQSINRHVISFYKTLSRTIQNKRLSSSSSSNNNNNNNSQHAGPNMSAFSSSTPCDENYFRTEEFLQRHSIFLIHRQNAHDAHSAATKGFASDSVLISASDPLIFALPRGSDAFFALDFPETPFVNAGTFLVRPFETRTFSFLATMWYEFEDLDSIRNPQHIKNRALKQSTLGLYRILPRQILSPFGGLSRQSLRVHQTVLKCQEMHKLTDDKTEDALLEGKKTLIMLCSVRKEVPFAPAVLSEDQLEREAADETIALERYFPDLNSFQQPDKAIAPEPAMIEEEYRIALVQNGKVMDSYTLPTTERVLDMTVAYLTCEKPTVGTSTIKQYERRVFVVVSTLEVDKRGEDTQGNGKIIVLGLDYSMFQKDKDAPAVAESTDSANVISSEESKDKDSGLENDSRMGVDAAESAPAVIDAKGSSNGLLSFPPMKNGVMSAQSLTAQQSFLGSIRPKLKQLTSTTGPASVLMQMPNFANKDSTSAFASMAQSQIVSSSNPWSNYIITTVGSTLYLHKFNPSTFELEQAAFFFARFFVTSVSVIKNYIVLSDMFNSVQLLYFREEDCSIHLVAKDFDKQVITKTDIIVDGGSLGIVAADDAGNVMLFQENPKKTDDSLGGSRLISLGNFHLGSEASLLLSHELLYAEPHTKRTSSNAHFHTLSGAPMPPPPPPPPRARRGSSFPLQIYGTRMCKQQFLSNASFVPNGTGASSVRHRRMCTIVGTMDGEIGCLLPVEERMHKRLGLLQQVMSMLLPSSFALNPKDFRTTRSAWSRKSLNADSSKRVVLDGRLLNRYLSLDYSLQDELAQIIGSHSQVLRENLHELELLMRFF